MHAGSLGSPMRFHHAISIVASEARLCSPSELAAFAGDGTLPVCTGAELIERALAPVRDLDAAVLVVGGAADASPASAVDGVVRAAQLLNDGKGRAAVIVAIDPATTEWALLTLVVDHQSALTPIARLTSAADGPSLAAALSRGDIDLQAVDLISPEADSPATASRMIREWIGEGAFDDAPLPWRTASPVIASASAVRGLAAICALARAVGTRSLPPFGDGTELARPFSASVSARPWISGRPRRAAAWSQSPTQVSVVVFAESAIPVVRGVTSWPRRLVLLSALDRARLIQLVRECLRDVTDTPSRSAGDWAEEFNVRRKPHHRVRAALVVRDTDDLRAKLAQLADAIDAGPASWQTPDGMAFSDQPDAGKTVFLFPGQGAQFPGMFGDLCRVMPGLQDWIDRLQATYPATEYCPPNLIVAPPTAGVTSDDQRLIDKAVAGLSRGAMVTLVGSLALGRLLMRAGARADAIVGYSNGENAALVMAGAWQLESLDELLGLLHVVRLHDEDHPVERGKCIAVNQASATVVQDAIARAGGDLAVALENCPDQRVLFGAPDDIARVSKILSDGGAMVIPMVFDRGHHTARYQPTVERLRAVYGTLHMQAPEVPMYSCVTAAPFPADADGVRDLAVSQWARTVRFGATIERLYADGFRTFVEVGPGSTLTGFVRNTLRGRPHVALSTHVARRPGLEHLLQVFGRLYVSGHDVSPAALADKRIGLSRVGTEDRVASPVEAPAPSMVQLTPAAVVPDAPIGGVVEAHFALMREFLDQQARVHDLMVAALSNAPAAPLESAVGSTAVCDLPLLGTRITTSLGHLVADRRFARSSDLFLRHHTFGPVGQNADPHTLGLPVMPFTMSLELVVEAACRLSGRTPRPLHVRNARGTRWMALDGETLDVRIDAQLAETQPDRHEVHVRVFDVTGADPRPSFEAFVTLDEPPPSMPAVTASRAIANGDEVAAGFNARLFHGPLFRRITRIVGHDDKGVVVRAVAPGEEGFFAGQSARFATSPSLLDTAAQALGFWWAAQNDGDGASYPYLLERYVQWEPIPPGTEVVIAAAVARVGPSLRADIAIRSDDGRLLACAIGLSMRIFSFPPAIREVLFGAHGETRLSLPISASPVTRRLEPLPALLVDKGQGIWLRTIAARVLTDEERSAWYGLDEQLRATWLLRRLAAKEVVQDVLARRAAPRQARELDTEEAGGIIRVRVRASGGESLGVSLADDHGAIVATLDGGELVADASRRGGIMERQ